jgi:hypothetical protein
MEKVERLMNEYRGDDLGVAGVAETLAALSNGQAEEMLITKSAGDLKYDEAEVTTVLKTYWRHTCETRSSHYCRRTNSARV